MRNYNEKLFLVKGCQHQYICIKVLHFYCLWLAVGASHHQHKKVLWSIARKKVFSVTLSAYHVKLQYREKWIEWTMCRTCIPEFKFKISITKKMLPCVSTSLHRSLYFYEKCYSYLQYTNKGLRRSINILTQQDFIILCYVGAI